MRKNFSKTILGFFLIILSGIIDCSKVAPKTAVVREPTSDSSSATSTSTSTSTSTDSSLPTCNLTVDKDTVYLGSSVTLTLAVTGNVTSATLDGTSVNVSGGSATKIETPDSSMVYYAALTGPAGLVVCSVAVTVLAVPMCRIGPVPVWIAPGGSTKLYFSANSMPATLYDTDGTTPILQLQSTGSVSSTVVTLSTVGTYTYTGFVKYPGGTNTCSATVTVSNQPAPAPTCTMTADPAVINSGDTSTITMTTSGDVTSITFIDGRSISGPTTLIQTNAGPTVTTTYTGSVTGPGGTTTCNVTVTVN